MIYLTFSVIAVFSFLIITKDRNAFFSCLVKIETFSVVSPISMLSSARAVDRFSAVLSASAKSLT
jgi:hypothetical protein